MAHRLVPLPHGIGWLVGRQAHRHHPAAPLLRVLCEEEHATHTHHQQHLGVIVTLQAERIPHEGEQLLTKLAALDQAIYGRQQRRRALLVVADQERACVALREELAVEPVVDERLEQPHDVIRLQVDDAAAREDLALVDKQLQRVI